MKRGIALVSTVVALQAQFACSDEERPATGLTTSVYGACAEGFSIPREPQLSAVLRRTWGADGTGVEFSEIKSVAVSGDGTIFVADGLSHSIKFLPTDSLWREFGQEGQGPGEFQYPTIVAVTQGDTIVVFDEPLWRLSYFSRDSLLARSQDVPAMAGFGQSTTLAVAPSGGIYALGYGQYQTTAEQSLSGKRKGIGRGMTEVVQLAMPQRRWREVFEVPGTEVFIDLDEGSLQDIWFGATPHLAVSDKYVWSADGRNGMVFLHDRQAGSVCTVAPQDSDHVAVTDAERDSFYLGKDAAYRGDVRVSQARVQRRGVTLPAEKPAILRMVSDDERVWIQLPQGGAHEDLWLALRVRDDHQVTVEASVRLPRPLIVLAIDDDNVYGTRLTSTGVPILEEYQLRGVEASPVP